jgi:hypothetical protein
MGIAAHALIAHHSIAHTLQTTATADSSAFSHVPG